mgnify:CR=1 FL=1
MDVTKILNILYRHYKMTTFRDPDKAMMSKKERKIVEQHFAPKYGDFGAGLVLRFDLAKSNDILAFYAKKNEYFVILSLDEGKWCYDIYDNGSPLFFGKCKTFTNACLDVEVLINHTDRNKEKPCTSTT